MRHSVDENKNSVSLTVDEEVYIKKHREDDFCFNRYCSKYLRSTFIEVVGLISPVN